MNASKNFTCCQIFEQNMDFCNSVYFTHFSFRRRKNHSNTKMSRFSLIVKIVKIGNFVKKSLLKKTVSGGDFSMTCEKKSDARLQLCTHLAMVPSDHPTFQPWHSNQRRIDQNFESHIPSPIDSIR